jgi:hypothetical protein
MFVFRILFFLLISRCIQRDVGRTFPQLDVFNLLATKQMLTRVLAISVIAMSATDSTRAAAIRHSLITCNDQNAMPSIGMEYYGGMGAIAGLFLLVSLEARFLSSAADLFAVKNAMKSRAPIPNATYTAKNGSQSNTSASSTSNLFSPKKTFLEMLANSDDGRLMTVDSKSFRAFDFFYALLVSADPDAAEMCAEIEFDAYRMFNCWVKKMGGK